MDVSTVHPYAKFNTPGSYGSFVMATGKYRFHIAVILFYILK